MKEIQKITSIKDVEAIVIELQNIYKEWLEVFPFELEIFSHLKEEFANELPILRESYIAIKDNSFDIVVDFYSDKTFQQFLAQKTTKLISEINTLALLENGKINDIEKHKLDLIVKGRRLKLQSQVKWSRFKKPDYLDSISEWLSDEKQFISEITPYLDRYSLDKTGRNKKKLPAKFYALYHRILIDIKEVSPFKLVNDTELPKKEIENYGVENYGFEDGQNFYRHFSRLYTAKPHEIALEFGKGYKEKIIDLSQNCAKVIKHIEKYPR